MKLIKPHPLTRPNPTMGRRVVSIFCVLCVLFTFLYLRISLIQADDYYSTAGAQQSGYTLTIPTERGTIYDTNFSPLTNQEYVYYAAVLPTEGNLDLLKEHAVSLTAAELDEKLKEDRPYVCEVDTYELTDANIKVFPVHDRYAGDQMAIHLIGYLDEEKNGVTGLEKAYNDLLTQGTLATEITYTLNGQRQSMTQFEPEIAYGNIPNQNVVLTLDAEIQAVCERIGSEMLDKGAIVVMESATGKIRGMCSFPTYTRGKLSEAVKDEDNSPMLNRALNACSVGSDFKVVTTATALAQGISPEETYTCSGGYTLGTQTYHCHKLEGHGLLNLKEAMMASCNPFFINMGLELQPKSFLQTANDMGFGKKNELAPGLYSQSGKLPTLAELEADQGNVANFSFGQGNFTATPVQLAQMISCVVNDGFTPNPMLVEGLSSDGKSLTEPYESTGMQGISKTVARALKQDLIACVMENEGQNAKPNTTTAGGKTGTAQTGVFVDGKELNNGWFAGFFPAEEPKYTVVVLAENAVYGNEEASPVFRDIADSLTVLGK